MSNTDYSHLLPVEWDPTKLISWFQEDVPSFDYGGVIVGDKDEVAILYCKADGVMCGKPFVDQIFKSLDCSIEWKEKEGSFLKASERGGRIEVAIVKGQARKLLVGERVALNLMARASGISTRARQANELVQKHGFKGKVAATRKTTPGFRAVEKYAVLVGGCDTHRMDLSSMIMLKDNHVWSCGNITNAVKKAKEVGGFSLKIEVECRSFEEAEEAIAAGADVIMLDNFEPPALKETAKRLKAAHKHVLIEASGGVTLETLPEYFCNDVDIISMGSLTQGVPHIDFSLKVKRT
eukprot:TRINITY_DN3090_c0_g1_i1.p1 TRINITY_DN3090_c0_g1~~TRINITY_DN3090_c0_g1_i1.p1  ORF type:complete len:328 (+),score=75.75 TRINITY_DN3090_c0_g1_i1:103-984(+)